MKAGFRDYFVELMGEEEASAFFDAIEAKDTRRAVRVNTLKASVNDVKDWLIEQGYEVTESPFSSDGLELGGRGERLALKLPYHAGFTYPQDPSSMFAVELLDPQPGELVVDLTAAPGGKTTHIAQRMQNKGVLMANDMDSRRLKALHSNLERLGIWNTVVTRMEPYKLSLRYPERFDRILLDPSCSGEGLLVTSEGKANYWNKKSLKRYSAEQVGLLCSAFRMLKPGGRLVYSTCTLNDVEDDGVVDRLLKKFPEAEIESIDHPRTPEQIGDLKGIRFWPHKTQTKGFFCIAITKTASLELEAEGVEESLDTLSSNQLEPYEQFLKKQFGLSLPELPCVLRDDHLFMVSEDLARFDFPRWYSLSMPLIKNDGEMRLTHAGALLLGLTAETGIYELSREEVEAVFERQHISYEGDERGARIARYQNFPIGNMKLTDRGVEVLLPKQF